MSSLLRKLFGMDKGEALPEPPPEPMKPPEPDVDGSLLGSQFEKRKRRNAEMRAKRAKAQDSAYTFAKMGVEEGQKYSVKIKDEDGKMYLGGLGLGAGPVVNYEEMESMRKKFAAGGEIAGIYAGLPPSSMIGAHAFTGARIIDPTAAAQINPNFKEQAIANMKTGIASLIDSHEAKHQEGILSNALRALKELAVERGDISIEQLLEQLDMTDEQKTAEELALQALATKMTSHWTDVDFEIDPDRFSLSDLLNLTIHRPPSATKPGFSKKGHIGGEEFTPATAYVGKRGHIICVFKPAAPEDYATMEMPLEECFGYLTGFQRHFVEAGFSAEFNAIKEARVQKVQAENLTKFGERYEDFGTY